MAENRKLRVFLSHSHHDKPIIRALYNQLRRVPWVEPWLDEANLLPGQDWKYEIREAMRQSDVIIIFISRQFVKSGYVNKEIQTALDEAAVRTENRFFIIPVRLEEAEIPESLAYLQYVDYFEKRGARRLLEALRSQASALNIGIEKQINAEKAIPLPRPRPTSSNSLSMIGILIIGIMASLFILTSFVDLIKDIRYLPWFLPPNSKTPTPTLTLIPILQKTRTVTPHLSKTMNPTQLIQTAFNEIDGQFDRVLKGNIAFNKPEKIIKDETASIELILSPALSEYALATQVVERGDFVTSTAEPNVLISPSGERITVETSQIEITQRMKAVLLPQDPEAFTVKEMHDNAQQVVSAVEPTIWRWSITAKKEGRQTLELVIYQLVKYDGKDYWHEVQTYKTDIMVEVTKAERIKSWWITVIGAIGAVTAIVISIQSIWKWFEERKRKTGAIKVEIVNDGEKDKQKKKGK